MSNYFGSSCDPSLCSPSAINFHPFGLLCLLQMLPKRISSCQKEAALKRKRRSKENKNYNLALQKSYKCAPRFQTQFANNCRNVLIFAKICCKSLQMAANLCKCLQIFAKCLQIFVIAIICSNYLQSQVFAV